MNSVAFTILVTSRERLNLQAEWLFDVEGLSYPPDDPHGSVAPQSLADLTDYSAVQLFVQRAHASYYLALADAAAAHWDTPTADTASDQHDYVRATQLFEQSRRCAVR